MTPKCEMCQKGTKEGVTLYRANPKGKTPAVWRCENHLNIATAHSRDTAEKGTKS
jgi:hypothetical protein